MSLEKIYLFRYIWDCMTACRTGKKRIPVSVPDGAIVIHKTGTRFPSPEGMLDMNDVGIVLFPNGQCFMMAVFIRNSDSETQVAETVKQLLVTYSTP